MDILQTALCEKLKVANTQLLGFHLEKLIQKVKVIVHYCFPHNPKRLVNEFLHPYLPPANEVTNVCHSLRGGGPHVPLPMVHWDPSHSPMDTRPGPTPLDSRHGTYPLLYPLLPLPLLLTSGSNHWRPVQTCSLQDLPPTSTDI